MRQFFLLHVILPGPKRQKKEQVVLLSNTPSIQVMQESHV